MKSRFMSAVTAAATALALLWLPVARAEAADTTKFSAACLGAQEFLLTDIPDGVDPDAVLAKLCSCLLTEFSGFSQPEIDILATDLDGTATEDTHKAFPDYATLQSKAGDGLNRCFETKEVTDLLNAPAPATPAAPTVQ